MTTDSSPADLIGVPSEQVDLVFAWTARAAAALDDLHAEGDRLLRGLRGQTDAGDPAAARLATELKAGLDRLEDAQEHIRGTRRNAGV